MSDETAIRAVIERSYVNGIHRQPNRDDVLAGFDPAFRMFVLADGAVTPVTIDEFVEKKLRQKAENPKSFDVEVTYDLTIVELLADTAVIRIDLSRDGVLTFTDFMFLYRQGETWKIVAKVYHGY